MTGTNWPLVAGLAATLLAASGCSGGSEEPAGPKDIRTDYILDFSGDIIATGVPARADPNDLWGSFEITALVAVTLPATLQDDEPFYQVNWPPGDVAVIDPSGPFDSRIHPYCTYSETNALRPNSWGANAQLWPDTKVSVKRDPETGPDAIRIDLRNPALLLGGQVGARPTLLVAARDVNPVISATTLRFTQGQALVAAGGEQPTNPDPNTDPCISVTITATRAP